MFIPTQSSATTAAHRLDNQKTDAKLREAANELEATFLAEMLKSAGFGEARDSFGGGAGEEQFSGFLRMEQARAMVKSGGIGLSEAFFEALKEKTHGQ